MVISRRPTKKPTRTQLKAKADRLFADHIRSHGHCEAEGYRDIQCSARLQCAHIIDRGEYGVRWNALNAVCLCSSHHVWFTTHKLQWEIWRDGYIGEGVYKLLREKAIAYVGPPDYAKVLAELEAGGPVGCSTAAR